MPIVVVGPRDPPPCPTDRGGFDLVLVNNMPDGAFLRTETQLLGLLEAGSGPLTVRVRRFSLPVVARSPSLKAHMASEYFALPDLWSTAADAVLVSGSEPRAEHLRDEPYWDDLERLLTWACDRSASALLSCLAAHAALLIFDGVDRRPLPGKCSGVFAQTIQPHLLTEGVQAGVAVPHSRLNEVSIDAVRDRGYSIPLEGPTGWTIAAKEHHGCLLALVQGHPEYDSTSLLREYRRDARRYVERSQGQPPVLPQGCVAASDAAALERFHQRVAGGERTGEILDSFPFDEAYTRVPWPWRQAATAIYANWLTEVHRRYRPSLWARAGAPSE